MRTIAYCLAGILLLTGCSASSSVPAVTATPGPAPLTGTVDIQVPESGAVIYSELLYVAGSASGVPSEGFKIQLFDLDEGLMAEAVVQPAGESWSVEIPHQYAGDPTEVSLVATGIDAVAGQDYDVEAIVLSAISNRPEGTFASISAPTEGSTIGGDQIQVSGTGSGLFENTLIIQLRQPDGTVIQEVILTLNNPYFVDEVIWSAEIPTNGYTGSAELVALYYSAENGAENVLAQVTVTIAAVAG